MSSRWRAALSVIHCENKHAISILSVQENIVRKHIDTGFLLLCLPVTFRIVFKQRGDRYTLRRPGLISLQLDCQGQCQTRVWHRVRIRISFQKSRAELGSYCLSYLFCQLLLYTQAREAHQPSLGSRSMISFSRTSTRK